MSVVRLGERIDLAHVIRPAGKRPEIRLGESFRMEGLPRDALARLAQNKGLKRYRCASLLGESQYRVAQLEAPSVPPEERVQALRWRLKDMVDFPVDGASIAVADIPAEGSRQANVFAIVAPREVIAERMALFHAARVPLEAIDIPEMAVRNVASLFEEPNRGLAFLVLNSGESLLTITYGGELYLSRRIEVSSQALAETDEERRQQMLERLALSCSVRSTISIASTALSRYRVCWCARSSIAQLPWPGWRKTSICRCRWRIWRRWSSSVVFRNCVRSSVRPNACWPLAPP